MASTGQNKGIMDQMGGMLDSILSLPDRPKSPAAKKAARIFADVVVIGLGFFLFTVMTRWNLATLANPSLTNLMSIPMCVLVASVGVAWLLEDVLGSENFRTAGKIMALIMPIALAAGAICLIGAGFHSGITPVSMGGYWIAGLLFLPLSLFAVGRAIKILGARDQAIFLRRQEAPIELDVFPSSTKRRKPRLNSL